MINNDITNLLNKDSSEFSMDQQHDISVVYQRLKEIASKQRLKIKGTGINTTALVNEAWIKSKKQSKTFTDRNHFFAYCALAMRHILLNEAKRNQILTFVEYDVNEPINSTHKESDYLLDLDIQLKNLQKFDPRLEQVFVYKYFGDMEFVDIAVLLNVSERTIFRNWHKARTMLAAAMST